MTLRDAAVPHALRSDLTDALGGGLVDPDATRRRLASVLGPGGSAVFVHRDRKAALRWLKTAGLGPDRPLDHAALRTPLSPRCVVLRAPEPRGAEPLLDWWRVARHREPAARGLGQDLSEGPPRSSWQTWHDGARCALAFHAEQHGLRIGVLLLDGLGTDDRQALLDHLSALAASVVRQYWLTWRARTKETLDAIAGVQFPVHLALPAAANQTQLISRVARSTDHLVTGIAAALEAPVAMLAMPDTTWTHIGRVGQVGFVDPGRPRALGDAERGLSLRFCHTPARVSNSAGTRAFHLPDGAAMKLAYQRFAITAPGAPLGPTGQPHEALPQDREAGFYPSDDALEPALCQPDGPAPDARRGPWSYASVPLDPWLWARTEPCAHAIDVPFDARRAYDLEAGDGCGVLKVQGRVRCALLDPPGALPAPYTREELRGLDRWAPELGRIVQRRIRQEEQALSDRLFEAAVSALVQGGLGRFVQLLQTFTQARCTALVHQELGSGRIGHLALSPHRDLGADERLALESSLCDPDAGQGLGQAWLFESQVRVGQLAGVDGEPVTFLKQPVTTLSGRRLALVWVGVPGELDAGPGPQPFPGVLRPALARVAKLLHSTLKYQEAAQRQPARAKLFGSPTVPQTPDYEAFASAWKTLQARLAAGAELGPKPHAGLSRFARDVAASFGQQGALARVLGVESQTVRRHMVAIVREPAAPHWRTLAQEGAVTHVAELTQAARVLAAQV